MPRIPKILHYCFGFDPKFGGKPWSLVHYVCVRSAIERIKPEKTFLYYEFEPTGQWWELTRKILNPVRIRAPREIFGNPVVHAAHRADVVRLEMLIETGGIYLDADVFVHKDFDQLLQNSVVLGEEGINGSYGLANAIILAEPAAPFLKRWYDEYRTFRSKGRDEFWGEHSVRVPLALSKKFPNEVTVLPYTAFYWPLWTYDGLFHIFGPTATSDGRSSLANHLWESAAWDAFLEYLTPKKVRKSESNFHRWARPLISDLPDNFGRPSLWRRFTSLGLKQSRRLISRAQRVVYRKLKRLEQAVPLISKIIPRSYDTYHRRRIFDEVYKQGLWGNEDGSGFYSGTGSRGIAAETYVSEISEILKNHEFEEKRSITVVDLGCGDFEIGRQLFSRVERLNYIGCDIVPELIAHHLGMVTDQRATFRVLDIVSDDLPLGDVCLVRQVLQHLSNSEIQAVLKKLKQFKKVYVTEAYPAVEEGPINPDKATNASVRYDWRTGRGRGVELNKRPYWVRTRELFRVRPNPVEVLVTLEIDWASQEPSGPVVVSWHKS